MTFTDYPQLVTADHVGSYDVTVDGRQLVLTILRCRNCGESHEYAYGPYQRCPFCGTKIVLKKSVAA